MNILILGSGGREHALAWKIKQSPLAKKVYSCPGNGGTENNIPGDLSDMQSILKIAQDLKIDLTIVGPEDPLCNGIVDLFEKNNMNIFGPNKKAAKLELSKDYSKKFMDKNKIKNARFDTVTTLEKAIQTIRNYTYPLVIKADGLCQGKGVIIVEDEKEALEVLIDLFVNKTFGHSANKVIIETFLEGREVSLICLVSNNKVFPISTARDYKKVYENDKGLNTGGIGAYSPAKEFSHKEQEEIDEILKNIETGLNKEDITFNGVLFIGLMLDKEGVNVLEFNVRFGDPETQVILPRLESDLLELMLSVNNQTLTQDMIKLKDQTALTTILISKGYPETFTTNHEIEIKDKGLVFQNGTKKQEEKILSTAGRVLSVVGLGSDLNKINKDMQERIKDIHYKNKSFRKDIGILS